MPWFKWSYVQHTRKNKLKHGYNVPLSMYLLAHSLPKI